MELVKMKGWIAKNGASNENERTYLYIYDNNIIFSEIKPIRNEYYKHWDCSKFYLSPKAFPYLKWEDDPVPVELVIKTRE